LLNVIVCRSATVYVLVFYHWGTILYASYRQNLATFDIYMFSTCLATGGHRFRFFCKSAGFCTM